jgi:hypothetical protein
MKMSRIPIIATFISVSLLALSPVAAWAISNAQADCEGQGGVFVKADKTCTTTQESSTSQGRGQGQTVTTTSTETAQGNFKKTEPQQTSCSGPGSSTGSAHCR